uniref:Phosphoglycerate mutase family protein n=1 Tax=Colletotrichum fructicola (strain Nara gc5) TaxID=1213859 RepID=L2G7H3_COLFN
MLCKVKFPPWGQQILQPPPSLGALNPQRPKPPSPIRFSDSTILSRGGAGVRVQTLEVGLFRSNWLVDPSTGNYTASIPSPTGIPSDPALTAHGVDQAKELGAHLLTVEPPIDAVYSSPYYRCLQTITPFVSLKEDEINQGAQKDVGAKSDATVIRPEHGLCEWYGAAPFDHPKPASPDVLKPMFRHLDAAYQSRVFPARKGETIAQLHDRVAAAVQAIIEQCDAEGKRAVVLCSHAASIIALGRVLTGNMPENIDAEDFRAFTCGLSMYRRKSPSSSERASETDGPGPGSDAGAPAETTSWRNGRGVGGGWVCELNSDCSFLSGGEERGW